MSKTSLKFYLDGSINWTIDKGGGIPERVDLSVLTTQDIEHF